MRSVEMARGFESNVCGSMLLKSFVAWRAVLTLSVV
jgi:hypothetical protein